jgi:hypothetical protein
VTPSEYGNVTTPAVLRRVTSGDEEHADQARQKPTKTRPARKSVVESPVLKQGHLEKLSRFPKRWGKRYFRLQGHYLNYSVSGDDAQTESGVKSSIDLQKTREVKQDGVKITLLLESGTDSFHVRAETEEDATSWAEVLRETVNAVSVSEQPDAPSQQKAVLQPALSEKFNLSRGNLSGRNLCDDIPSYLKFLDTPETATALHELLLVHGIESHKYGKNGAKTVENLFGANVACFVSFRGGSRCVFFSLDVDELKQGACVLATTKGGLRRIMHRVHVKARRKGTVGLVAVPPTGMRHKRRDCAITAGSGARATQYFLTLASLVLSKALLVHHCLCTMLIHLHLLMHPHSAHIRCTVANRAIDAKYAVVVKIMTQYLSTGLMQVLHPTIHTMIIPPHATPSCYPLKTISLNNASPNA